ncbi:hypothetical protein MKZ38_000200 [Zalerion maritima]|uniref:Uncharacterized protein n=1 Tax=Zalerion maritima TaxID=339359 RepID=A0AAD5RSL3_9PEZI|nr:hypothetical protein MKZ38_000200 [Zalerion maritima]
MMLELLCKHQDGVTIRKPVDGVHANVHRPPPEHEDKLQHHHVQVLHVNLRVVLATTAKSRRARLDIQGQARQRVHGAITVKQVGSNTNVAVWTKTVFAVPTAESKTEDDSDERLEHGASDKQPRTSMAMVRKASNTETESEE